MKLHIVPALLQSTITSPLLAVLAY